MSYPPTAGYAQTRPTNTLAIVSLVSSILSFFILPVIGAVAGIVTGHMAKGQIRRTGEQGQGLATAGIIIGWIHIALSVIGFVIFILIFAGIFFAASKGVHVPTPVPSPN